MSPAPARRRPRRNPSATVPVAIFYEDAAAAARALASVRSALRRQRDRRRVAPLLWHAGLLGTEAWRRFAADDVAAAELCLVSLGLDAINTGRHAVWFRALSRPDPDKWITLAPFAATPADTRTFRAAG